MWVGAIGLRSYLPRNPEVLKFEHPINRIDLSAVSLSQGYGAAFLLASLVVHHRRRGTPTTEPEITIARKEADNPAEAGACRSFARGGCLIDHPNPGYFFPGGSDSCSGAQ
jgi:hypothetical protein